MSGLDTPTISVCIANFNGIGVIEACIASVKSQTDAPSVEIIVHDDASSDGSVEYIEHQHPDVRLIKSSRNVGFCISNNRMASMAEGRYLLLLNNDATLLPNALASLFQAAQDMRTPAILGLPQYDAETGELMDVGSLLDPFLNPIPNRDLVRGEVGMVMGACLWIPRRLWGELGGFPEWFESIGEDLYLCCRARLAGYPIIALNVSGFRHRVGHSFGGGKIDRQRLSTNKRRRALSERNKTFVMLVTMPLPLLLVVFPIHIASLLVEGVAVSLARFDRTIWSVTYVPIIPAIWRQRRRLRQLRQESQGTRRISLRGWLRVFRPTPYKLTMLFRYGIPEIR